jgi:radical SAM superfamily enzyme YgiQ (UPF0313 family)
MKIILINPPPYSHGEKSRFLEKTPVQTYTMPLGIGYIASTLAHAGYRVSILDAYAKNLSTEEIAEVLKSECPDIIGITCLSDQRASWFKLIDIIRAVSKKTRIVLGGPHPSLMPEQVLTQFHPDAIVIGEGEETMLDLIRTWEEKGDLGSVNGIAYLDDGKVRVNSPRERIKDIDPLPFPSYNLVDLNDYKGWVFMDMLSRMIGLEKPPRYASISTSRGCTGDCGYCSSPLIWKRRWTQRSPENIVDEMEMLNREYGAEFIIMTDDIFSVNQPRVMSICREILRRELKVLWGFETAVKFVSAEMLHLAKQAGCCCILYGVESASRIVLSKINKNINEKDVVDAFQMTRDAGILSGAFLMVGNPGESGNSIKETMKLLAKIQPDIILPQIAMITPGTRIFDFAKEKGCIDKNYWLTDLPFPYYTCERRFKTLLRWYKKLFYHNQNDFSIALRTIRDYIEIHTGLRITKNGLSKGEIPSD